MNHRFCACYRHCWDMDHTYKHAGDVFNNCNHSGDAKNQAQNPGQIYARCSEFVRVEFMHVPGNVAVSTINNRFRVLVRINIHRRFIGYICMYMYMQKYFMVSKGDKIISEVFMNSGSNDYEMGPTVRIIRRPVQQKAVVQECGSTSLL